MQIYDLPTPLPDSAQNSVCVIGNFDAVHRGHQYLIAEARKIAAHKKAPLSVLTFEPHPRRLFRPDDPPFRITPRAIKLEKLAENNVDVTFICPFNWELAGLSADDFIAHILRAHINPAHIVIGEDFHFGQHRTGNAGTLRAAEIEVTTIPLKQDSQHAIISATHIRGAIQTGQITEANELLGWDWEMRGNVEHGNKRGREIGYPTANVALGDTIHPAYGIYATWVQIEGENNWRPAATNIGIRPMFEVETGLIEAYIFDYTGDLYGKEIRIRPVAKIRDEMKFNGLDELVQQIDKDCTEIRSLLKQHPHRN